MNGNWPWLFGAAGLLFGLMSPIYTFVFWGAEANSVTSAEVNRTVNEIGGLKKDVSEIETQFDWNRESKRLQFAWMADIENFSRACRSWGHCLEAEGGTFVTCSLDFEPYKQLPNGGPHGKER
jgi:hypothetical protein